MTSSPGLSAKDIELAKARARSSSGAGGTSNRYTQLTEDALYEAAFGADKLAPATPPAPLANTQRTASARPSNLSLDALYAKAWPAGEDYSDLDRYPAPTAGGDL